jgi:carbonic anhydrase
MFNARKTTLGAMLLAASVMLPAAGAFAAVQSAQWQAVQSGQSETIEIDKLRIVRGWSGTTAWSRINLGRDVLDVSGAYNAIEAQNLYDCGGRKFTTLRRAYFNGETLVREEGVARQKANSIQVGSIDERLFNEACKPRTVAEAKSTADLASQVAADTVSGDRPQAMHADVRTQAPVAQARVVPVADAHSAAPAGEKQKMIELPKIDKAAADAAAAAAGATRPAGSGAAPTGPSPTYVAPAKPAAHGPAGMNIGRPAQVLDTPKTVSPTLPPGTVDGQTFSRQARELQLATSGPRKLPARKPAAKDDEHGNPAANMHAHWGYEGEGGPANWGKLKGEYSTCATGKRQSPIDIREGVRVDLERIKFDYKNTLFRIIDNGHTVQVNVGEGSTINVMGKRFELVQFHFHRPSEERVNGRPYDMVAHLVHKDYDGSLAVIAVLLERGMEHPVIQTLWNNMPLEQNQELGPSTPIDLNKLLPDNREYWTYMGSLTTPPCTENVLWMVMKQPTPVSDEQISIFSRLYKNNARPVQPSNGRMVKESR